MGVTAAMETDGSQTNTNDIRATRFTTLFLSEKKQGETDNLALYSTHPGKFLIPVLYVIGIVISRHEPLQFITIVQGNLHQPATIIRIVIQQGWSIENLLVDIEYNTTEGCIDFSHSLAGLDGAN
jgi:hypothetical protein